MKVSARNQLRGKIKHVETGAVNSEIVIQLSEGVEVVSIITKQSAEDLNLKVGASVLAVIKASDVMIATE